MPSPSAPAPPLPPDATSLFTPYLAGERTPHDNPLLTAKFSGLTHMTGPHHLLQAVLEGVALALADGHASLGGPLIADAGSASPIIEVDPRLSEQLDRKKTLFHRQLP